MSYSRRSIALVMVATFLSCSLLRLLQGCLRVHPEPADHASAVAKSCTMPTFIGGAPHQASTTPATPRQTYCDIDLSSGLKGDVNASTRAPAKPSALAADPARKLPRCQAPL